MNAPMTLTHKPIFAKAKGLQIPPKIKRLLIQSTVIWYDTDPLSQDFGEALHFFFDTKTNAMADLLLKRYGLEDVSQFINIPLKWRIEVQLIYKMPNRETETSSKEHREIMSFDMHGLLYPMNKKFSEHRDKFYLLKNMEFAAVPDDHKNKKVFSTSKFTATVMGA